MGGGAPRVEPGGEGGGVVTHQCTRAPHGRTLDAMPPCPKCYRLPTWRICVCCGAHALVPDCVEYHQPDVVPTIGPDADAPGHWCDDCGGGLCPAPRRPREVERDMSRGPRARKRKEPVQAYVQADLFRETEEWEQLDLFEGVEM